MKRVGRPRIEKVVDEAIWRSGDGQVVKYSVAYINPRICGIDNGRVLGYDNSHEWHHRHFMGREYPVAFAGYKALAKQFYAEVRELWRKEDEGRPKGR